MEQSPAISRVLLIGVDSPIGLTVLRELGARGIEVVCVGRGKRSLGRHSKFASGFVEKPEGPIADWLLDAVRDHSIGAVMAVSEGDLIELSALKHAITDCVIAVPDADKLALVLDKPATLGAARAVGIAVPDSWQPQAGEDRAAKAETLAFPVAVKWADPNAVTPLLEKAGIDFEKVEYAESADALMALLARYDTIGTYPLVQTYCPGYGLGQMLNMKNGRATLRFQHRRLREWPVTGGVSTYCEAVPLAAHTEQMALSEKLLASIGWEGPAMVEYRFDPATGTYWLMEINGRFWGSIPLAHHAGAHFGWEAWRTQVAGEDDPQQPDISPMRARYMVPDGKHFAAVMSDGSRPLGDRLGFAARFAGQFLRARTGYYVWSWSDPAPFFADMKAILTKSARPDS